MSHDSITTLLHKVTGDNIMSDFDTAWIDDIKLSRLEWDKIDDTKAEAIVYHDGVSYYIIAEYKHIEEDLCEYEVISVKILQEFDQ